MSSSILGDFLVQIGGTAVALAIAGYLARIWLTHQFDKARAQNSHELAVKLEAVRAEWAREIARLNVHESYLHKRRVEILEMLFGKMIDAEFALQTFLLGWWGSTNKDELARRVPDYDPKETSESMRSRGFDFCEKFAEINAEMHKNALYFEETFLSSIKDAYEPIFDLVLAMDFENPPPIPAELKDVVNAGKAPRLAVINRFRKVLGVLQRAESDVAT
jgi:hypothetical protein